MGLCSPLPCVAVLFGVFEEVSGPSLIATLPEIAWERSLGICLIVKGFKPSPSSLSIPEMSESIRTPRPPRLPRNPLLPKAGSAESPAHGPLTTGS